jgi:aspartyl-tRNA(Asn)/glutamyl-tRNA(Gln) amidotransferase subunit B
MPYAPIIGLEIHAQLLTRTKIFCGCRTTFGDPPNTSICPVCLGMPGALPVLNSSAVDLAVRAALALNCTIQLESIFARKNYFYPDLPKGYQISQYDRPFATGGWLEAAAGGLRRRIGLTRVHLEEDAGKLLHHGFADSASCSYVDYNRSGVPLIEIVTEPELQSAAEAADFFSRLRELLVAIGVNDGNMEEGSLRCDANVSVRPAGRAAFGVKTEVKNVNSFRYLQKALEHEIERQIALLEGGGTVRQETRLWDAAAGRTVAMRSKEEAHDYRYFPEPDLSPLTLAADRVAAIRQALPELPDAARERLAAEYGLPAYDADILTRLGAAGVAYFEATVAAGAPAKSASNWILGEIRRKLNELGTGDVAAASGRVPPAVLAELLAMIEDGRISGSVAKGVFETMFASGRTAGAIVRAEGLAQIGDRGILEDLVRRTIDEHPGPVAQYRAGRTATLGFLVGQVMKATGGKANPKVVNELLRAALEK